MYVQEWYVLYKNLIKPLKEDPNIRIHIYKLSDDRPTGDTINRCVTIQQHAVHKLLLHQIAMYCQI